MPPKRKSRGGGSAKTDPPTDPVPSSSEDAKPSIDALNAEPDLPLNSPATEPEPSADNANVEQVSTTSPPARRLDSLSRSTRGTPSTRGKRAASAPRFAGRRSQAQREEVRKAEEERKRAEEAQQTTSVGARAGRGSRGHHTDDGYFGGRGVTSHRGRPIAGQRTRSEAVASGPFSAGQVSEEIRQLNRRHSRRSGWTGFQTGPVRGTEGSGSRGSRSRANNAKTSKGKGATQADAGPSTDVKPVLDANGDVSMSGTGEPEAVDGGYISSDEEDDKGFRRMNVEDLGQIDLTQDGVDFDFAPVRIARVAHKERTFGINADGVTNDEGAITVDANDVATITSPDRTRSKQKAKDVEFTGEKKRFQGVYSDSESDAEPGTHIKPDPESEDDGVRTPEPMPTPLGGDGLPQEPPSSPETKRKGKEKIKARAFSNDSLSEMPDYQTREEIEEWQRYQEDLRLIRAELGQPAPNADGSNNDGDTETHPEDPRKDKVYLFQFPPVLPDLHPITVKTDPDANADAGDIMNLDPPATTANNPITIQDNNATAKTSSANFPSGAVGKLRVHASGRVTLDWGGTSLAVGMGTEAGFLQDVLLATLPDRKEGGEEAGSSAEGSGMGKAVSMGRVERKFVVTPDWEELLG